MPSTHKPRSGSLQFWPRSRAKSSKPRVRSWAKQNESKPLAFIGYKAGMAHVMIKDNKPTSPTKGETIFMPVTIIECPAIKITSSRFYKNTNSGQKLVSEILSEKLDKYLKRKINIPKKQKATIPSPEDYDEVRILVNTQPNKLSTGKKKPELMEISLGGKKEDQLKFIKEHEGKDIIINDIFEENELTDIHAVTKGKGFQGPVKRFGISLRSHKSEKTIRGPGSLGPWKGQTHIMWKVAHAGQTGYHTRTEHNKQIIKISDNPEELNPKGGIKHYGVIKNTAIMIKGSIPGAKKRLIVITKPIRPKKTPEKEKSIIEHIILK
ncbi:50S ribosomal protein L3 [Candidatus Woesearchaeota archaeon]|nr:50S ribosomal protein L3 [Candidatus Woesearchaeota archaeon]